MKRYTSKNTHYEKPSSPDNDPRYKNNIMYSALKIIKVILSLN